MRDNPVKRKLEQGGIALGTMVTEFATPAILRLAGGAGPSSCFSTASTPPGASSGCGA